MSDDKSAVAAVAAPLMVTLKIDGRTATVPKGTNVLEAAASIGIPISYFCYHPGLSSPAVCRQCLVDVKGQPKLVPSCYTPASDNMEVTTASERVLTARRQMLEFTLVNHPVDCPICDKAGECTLQKLYMEWDGADSRVDHVKVHKPKRVDIGPHIVLDAERCILCTRCIRVCDEVAHDHQLEMAHRGDHEVLTTSPGRQLDNPYSLNTVDVCPVGALTAKDFRFTMRAWELYATPSVCPGCATGCNIEVHHAQGKTWRLVPRLNAEVNQYWMCDEGRFTYKELDEKRISGARVGGDPAPLDKACAFAAQRLSAAREQDPRKVGVVFGAQATNEDLYLLARAAVDALGAGQIFVAGRPAVPERADQVLRSADVNPNTAGARLMAGAQAGDAAALARAIDEGTLQALWVVGEDVNLPDETLAKLAHLDVVVQATHESALTRIARVVLPAAAWAEVDGTFTNRQGRPQRVRRALDPPGGALPHWQLALALARKLAADKLEKLKASGLLDLATPLALFNHMKAHIPELSTALWGKPLPLVQLRFAGSRG